MNVNLTKSKGKAPFLLRRFGTVWVFALALFSIGCGAKEQPPQPEPEEEASAEPEDATTQPLPEPSARVLPDTPVPEEHGLFVVDAEGNLREVPAGSPEHFHPTNAERGFGFERPAGVRIGRADPLFVLWTGSMALNTLRWTRFAPEALLPMQWDQQTSPGRAAWLPHGVTRLVVEPADGTPGMVRLRPVDPLSPGFYVLHDGSLIRGEQRSDVNAFYPIQIVRPDALEEPEESVWLDEASACVGDIVQSAVEAHVLEQKRGKARARFDRRTFARSQAARIEHCAESIYAVYMITSSSDVRERARRQLLALDVMAHGVDWSRVDQLLEEASGESTAAAILSYWLELEALDEALQMRRELAAGDVRSASKAAKNLLGLYNPGVPTTEQEALERLCWVPFFLDPRWERLDDLSARLATGVSISEEIAVLVAAHRVERLASLELRFPEHPLAELAGAMAANAPAAVLDARSTLDTSRGVDNTVQFGPAHIEPTNADPMLMGAVERWLRGRRKALAKCFEPIPNRSSSDAAGLVLVRVHLVTSMLGPASTVEVVAPPGNAGTAFGDETFRSCLENQALTGLPGHTVPLDATLTMPVLFHADREVGVIVR